MSSITLQGMYFYAFHGCFAEERAIGTRFRVDLTLETDTTKAQLTDNIADTVSYLDVYQTLKGEMMKPAHLLECVGDRIGERILQQYSAIDRVRVKVSKLNPPLGGQIESVSVEIIKDRYR